MNKIILDHDLELLSSYLDGQLSPADKKTVEKRLESDSAYKAAFEKLRRTHLLLHSLPQRAAPRNFTLSPEVVKKKVNIPSFFQIMRFSSAVAVLGLVILLVFDFLPLNLLSVGNHPLEVAQAPAASSSTTMSNEPPMIINWGTSQPEVFGKGGGGGGSGSGQTGTITTNTINEPATETSTLPNERAVSPPQPLSPRMGSTPAAQTEDTLAAPQSKEAESALSATGPILGIPPSAERGKVLSTYPVQPPISSKEKVDALRISELVLGGIALLTGIIAFVLHKKQG